MRPLDVMGYLVLWQAHIALEIPQGDGVVGSHNTHVIPENNWDDVPEKNWDDACFVSTRSMMALRLLFHDQRCECLEGPNLSIFITTPAQEGTV